MRYACFAVTAAAINFVNAMVLLHTPPWPTTRPPFVNGRLAPFDEVDARHHVEAAASNARQRQADVLAAAMNDALVMTEATIAAALGYAGDEQTAKAKAAEILRKTAPVQASVAIDISAETLDTHSRPSHSAIGAPETSIGTTAAEEDAAAARELRRSFRAFERDVEERLDWYERRASQHELHLRILALAIVALALAEIGDCVVEWFDRRRQLHRRRLAARPWCDGDKKAGGAQVKPELALVEFGTIV